MDFFKFQKKNLFTYFLLSIFAKTLPESYVSDVAAPKKKFFRVYDVRNVGFYD